MEQGLVTIVIPVYNGANFMREAIDSALHQTYTNCEILVINDGSTDRGETERIALSYGNKIRYFRKENGGTASALNYAIDRMKGEYFAWLSHDDIYYSDKILRQIQWMKQYRSKFSFCDYHILREDGTKTKIIAENCYPSEYLTHGVLPVVNAMIQFGAVLLHKSIIDEYGKFDEQLRTTQDFEYLFRISKKISPIYVPEILYAVRTHRNQGSNTIPTVSQDADQMFQMFLEQIDLKEKEKAYGSSYGYYYQMFLNIWPQKHLKDSFKVCIQSLFETKDNSDVENNVFDSWKDKRIYLYGAGNYGKRLLLDMQIRGIKVEGFIDKKVKGSIANLPCITPEQAQLMKKDIFIIVAAIVVDEISEELKQRGFREFITKAQFDKLSIKNPPPKYKIIPTILNCYHQVCIYGAGVYGIRNYLLLKESGVKVTFFCDRDPAKQGIVLDDIKCISLEELEKKEKENMVMFICIQNGAVLREKFETMGIPYVCTSETISDWIVSDILNPYQNKEKLDLDNTETINKINGFRNYLVHMEDNTADISDLDTADDFERMLKDILVNEQSRKKHKHSGN